MSKSLRIVLTREEEDNEDWASLLRERGHQPISFPCLEVKSIESPSLIARFRKSASRADWLVVTSPRGARIASRLLDGFPELKVASLSPKTGEAASLSLGRSDYVGQDDATSGSFAQSLLNHLSVDASLPLRILLAIAENGRREFEEALRSKGHWVERVAIYRVTPMNDKRNSENPSESLLTPSPDVIFLTSPSAVQGWTLQSQDPSIAPLVTMGPTTSDSVRRAGLEVSAESKTRNLEGLLRAATDLCDPSHLDKDVQSLT